MAEENASYGSEKQYKDVEGVTTSELPADRLEEKAPEVVIASRFGTFGTALNILFQRGVEARGVERVPENERSPRNSWNNLLMWFSVNCVLTTVPIGVLAQEFYTLTLPHAIGIIIGFAAIGCATTAFIATLGPQTGLRTMVITRYSVGYVGGAIFSILNILTQLGFSVIAVILGGQTLHAVNHNLPLVVGVIIIGICSLLVCFVGYNFLHHYERYAWIVTFIIFMMIYGLGGHAGYHPEAQKPNEDRGVDYSADLLSFGGIIFSSCSGWAPVAADYNVRLPADINPLYVFTLTWLGLFIPIVLIVSLGATLMTITNEAYVNAFADGGTGGLIGQVLSPWGGFGKFLLVLLALSVIANNIPNTYSAALSIQALHKWFALVPRAIWTILVFVIYTVAGVAGREHFSDILSNFLAILGYWTAFFFVVLCEEHFIFRRKNGRLGGYDLTAYDSPSKLPLGIAGILACCFGVAGAVVGMAEVWYIGPLAKHLGPFGGDMGFELAAAFTAVTYPPLRYLEIRYTGR
ncbi:hypothetical protein PUNSTDRAFT_142573 [Punctularia strigosozonata HHB-11173 SS5]|uniref:uncharacterized protein n=1 Tax=Punctularia strigosozonata (strain HHB-11173) TaxID=741275 RepID=UPI00044162AF|nr:uncharacterized protein PUNSTDRAFT_142573 [Punctularia strigosozonata HHB-11173 SS5]EIN10595.1 hypothetical protein PUNSTDRAFT_142573 [Punctularia strigosozonata HHB-11173 SS5]